ncbi:1,4-dihydroxy-2-naphthoate polyprenyltransferase [Anaerolinea thermophila]|uniref:1,4-dihydroxy-2-naphthoate octaprenyltransferase n=1 Tax=Anaerolinea thermophila (strain DSM 14523 / JCM 11388 / NBRC 100420 / UNI-1) TaxID=926569 RepID=E8N321_ANATU|nr:1,4-dihydroxy-2-naphthoate polyprenyltransferase [Anaerolinea thermophila]BAJ65171.1 1,4-dihydroxy-2-naphthoate octaprenyltransferase [Anaerolinea thermophila UNI-1]
MTQAQLSPTSPLRVWWMAARPRTLPAAIAPVIAASALAFYDGMFRWDAALAALLGALFLQIGANLANDVYDYQKGADTSQRVGPTRVTQAGLLTSAQVKMGMAVVFGLAALCGVYLTLISGWLVIAIGVLSIISAVLYTAGPYPLGYNGLGDLFVYLFFGLAAVAGTYYVHTRTVSLAAVALSVPIGALVVNILVVNNLRDIPTDTLSGKRTLAVRFGADWTRKEYLSLTVLAYLAPLLMALSGLVSPWILLCWLSIPKAIPLVRQIYTESGRALNLTLAGTGQLELLYCLLMALGLALAKFLA